MDILSTENDDHNNNNQQVFEPHEGAHPVLSSARMHHWTTVNDGTNTSRELHSP